MKAYSVSHLYHHRSNNQMPPPQTESHYHVDLRFLIMKASSDSRKCIQTSLMFALSGGNNFISTAYLPPDSSLSLLRRLCHHSSRDRSQPRTIGGEPSGISWCESGGVRGVSRLFIPTSVSIQLRVLMYSLCDLR